MREYPALLVPTFEYCAIPKVDAFALGYPEAGGGERLPRPDAFYFVSPSGYGNGALIKMAEVHIGATSLRDIDFVTHDVLQATGVDVILGRNLLEEMKFQLDYGSHQFKLERTVHPT